MTAAADRPRVGGRQLRDAMSHFATGVAVVTVEHDGHRHGMTINSLTSVSLEPPLILICLARGTRTLDAILASGAFVVNVLSNRQDEIANRFARPSGDDRFAGLAVRANEHGLPELPAIAHLTCRVHVRHDGGDHEVIVGAVIATSAVERSPLIFYRGKYDTLAGDRRDADWYW